MDLHLADKVAIVTGSSLGIGYGIAAALTDVGTRVAVVGRDQKRMNQTAVRLDASGEAALGIGASVADRADVKRMVDTTVARPVDETTRSFYAGDRYRRGYCDDGLLTATSRCYGNGYGSPYGYTPYGYAPYGWGGSGYGYGYAYGAPPVIIVRGSGSDAGGRVVKGRGYTRSGSEEGTTETARPRSNTGSTSSAGNSGSSSGNSGDRQTTRTREGSSSSSGSSTRSSGSGGQSTGRTAKPRNP